MDKAKAKKAVKKSESRKKSADPSIAVATAKVPDLQPADGYVNPYRAMGTMAPTMYSAGNMLDGYNFPQMVNPEA